MPLLRGFLEHVLRGTNYATGKTGSPLDYIGFHAKGRPRVVDGHVQMGSRFQLRDIAQGFEIVSSFPELRRLPVIIGVVQLVHEIAPVGREQLSGAVHRLPPIGFRSLP